MESDRVESKGRESKRIGVISDTHGLIRPELFQALAGVDLIIHAGDIGSAETLRELGRIAPVIAVRGNCDRGELQEKLPERETVQIGNIRLYVLHSINELDIDPVAQGYGAVIYGHSHCPDETWKGGVLYLNPGSAGPRRFHLPVTAARLEVCGQSILANHIRFFD
ncbi:YfcE family phosphodiesterase [Heliobacterium undosum]|uniref:Phosphoesterase n=1 Tax=Heliomicrobium undosum TaxID=121734 RepID=A0A845L7C0_9FIRM|nr:metallophosphoesterase family protein [Heliomicrobium undosum]MZP30935.1 YfcE family phosphodiesterase [Heliomicrobium undosum]